MKKNIRKNGKRGLNYNSRTNIATNAIDGAKPFNCIIRKNTELGLNCIITEHEFFEELKRHAAGEF